MPNLTYTLELAGNADAAGAIRVQTQTTAAFVDEHGGYLQADHIRAALHQIKHLSFVSLWDSNGRTVAGFYKSLTPPTNPHDWQVTIVNPHDPDDQTTLTIAGHKLQASILDILQRQPALRAGLDRVAREVAARKLEQRAAQLRQLNTIGA